jgi:hypothetical protein
MNKVKWVIVISDSCKGTVILLWFSTISLRGFVMSPKVKAKLIYSRIG